MYTKYYLILYFTSKYNGYVYGDLVRDFLVPLIIYGQNINNSDFKDIDICKCPANFCYNYVPLFMIDVMSFHQLSVNDFLVNLLIFGSRDQDFI